MRNTFRTRRAHSEDGVAMITVLISSMIVLALFAAVTSYAVGSLNLSRRDQDWNGALASAEAGIDDFVLRLNLDPAWADKVSSTQSCSTSPTKALRRCSTWASVPGVSTAEFTYSVESISSTAGISLLTTGRVGGLQRTIRTIIKRTTFLDYAYFSDRETSNPDYFDTPDWTATQITAEQANNWCDAYWFQGSRTGQDPRNLHARTANPSGVATRFDTKPCDVTEFSSGDTFTGPVRPNDVLFFQGGSTFDANSYVTIGRPSSPTTTPTSSNNYGEGNFWINTNPDYKGAITAGQPTNASVVPKFNGGIGYGAPIELPPDNSAIEFYAESAEGCRYYGPTRLEFLNTGKIQVWSPLSLATDVAYNNRCAAPNGGIMDPPSQTLVGTERPSVIYVEDAPADRAAGCNANSIWTAGTIGLPLNPLSTSDYNNSSLNPAIATRYQCAKGNAFIGGTYNGQFTVGSADKIVVVKDIKRTDTSASSNDVMGLLPNDSVEMWHPVSAVASVASRTEQLSQSAMPDEVHAAILCVNGSWKAENYHSGSAEGTYTLTGTLAQRYRGRMAQSPYLDYTKQYIYDTRYKTLAPPRFLSPQRAAYGVVLWAEQRPG